MARWAHIACFDCISYGNLSVMHQPDNGHERVRRFNEGEAVWRRFQRRRALRRLCRSGDLLTEDIFDHLDWAAAERECREVRGLEFLGQ